MQSLQTDDHLPLHLRQWEAGPTARGSVLLVHGLGEHVGRYAAVADALNHAGWTVWGYDHRGHGASGGARGSLAADDSLLRDLARVIDALRAREPGALVLLGHSMTSIDAGYNRPSPADQTKLLGLVPCGHRHGRLDDPDNWQIDRGQVIYGDTCGITSDRDMRYFARF